MKKQRKRIYTALLCTCFLLSTASVPVSAAETEQEEMTTLSNRSGVVTVESVQAMIDALPDAVKNPFADVNAGDWFYRDVLFSYEKGLMSGMDAAAFAPYANTTRAQIAVIFYRMEGSPAVEGENSFADVVRGSGTAWFYDAVTWAQKNGIMGGYDNSSFAPNDPITREQLAAIFYRYAQYKGYDTTQGGMAIREFDDYESISDYAMSAMAWAVNTGLVKGDSNLLYPNGTATRAELAALLHRFVENGMK